MDRNCLTIQSFSVNVSAPNCIGAKKTNHETVKKNWEKVQTRAARFVGNNVLFVWSSMKNVSTKIVAVVWMFK